MKHSIQYLFLSLLLTVACQPQFDMVPPGTNGSKLKEFSENWYVTLNGSGSKNGKDWGNAMTFQKFLSMITDPDAMLTTSAFHIREGEYLVTKKNSFKLLSRDVGCIRGGYSSDLTYNDLTKCDPSLYPTIFSGDVNKNGVADDGDGAFAKVESGNIRFDNITFRRFYLSNAAVSSQNGLSAVLGINGPYTSTSVECRNCIFEENVSGVDSNTNKQGAPCAFVTQGYFKAHDCIFRNNSTHSRGGAIRTFGKEAVLFLDRSLFTGNKCSELWGSALQCSDGIICMNNCTLVGNVGNGSTLNGGGSFLVVNSTLIDDADVSNSNAAFRCESPNKAQALIVNSVLSSSKSGGYGLVLNNNGKLNSGGYNLFKNVKVTSGSSADPTKSSDTKRDVVLQGSIQGNTWVWNVSQVMSYLKGFAIVDDVYDAVVSFNPQDYSEIAVVGRAFSAWLSPISLMKDARGSVRGDDRFQPGSYDPNID